jgi:restriction endonuclease
MAINPFKLEYLNYQRDAVDAVVRVFDGTPKTPAHEAVGTKSIRIEAERRSSENRKITCGRKHFALREDVTFKVVTELGQLL